jgi:hypothetical protein
MPSAVVVLVLTAGVALAACGSDDGDSSGSGSGSPSAPAATTPEDRRVSDARVAAGLAEITSISTRVADAVEAGDEDAADLNDSIEPEWQAIEGTIKANDEDVYITFEDTFALLGNAVDDDDAAAAKDAADTIGTAVDDYLAEHPE